MIVAVVLTGIAFVLRLVLRLNDIGAIPMFVLTPRRMDALLAGSFTGLLGKCGSGCAPG